MQTAESTARWFADTVAKCRLSLFRVARVMTHTDADAEDAVSTAIVAAWEHLGSIRKRDALPGYLMRCTVNACRNIFRQSRRETVTGDLEAVSPPYREETPLWVYLSRLPEKYRLPIQLRYGENFSLEDTASILRIPKGTVSSRCSRGLEILKNQLTKEE